MADRQSTRRQRRATDAVVEAARGIGIVILAAAAVVGVGLLLAFAVSLVF